MRPHSARRRWSRFRPPRPPPRLPQAWSKFPAESFDFKVQGTEIEGSAMPMVDVQYPWEDTPRRFHEHSHAGQAPFFIDKFPVTNAQFKQFLDATHYAPKDSINFLRDWKNGTYPQGWDNRPVTWVSLEDARAYAKVGRQAPAPRVGVATGSAGHRWPRLSLGQLWQPANVPTPDSGPLHARP